MRPCLLLRGRAGMPAMADPVDREAFVSVSGMFPPVAEGAGRRGRLRRDANRQSRGWQSRTRPDQHVLTNARCSVAGIEQSERQFAAGHVRPNTGGFHG